MGRDQGNAATRVAAESELEHREDAALARATILLGALAWAAFAAEQAFFDRWHVVAIDGVCASGLVLLALAQRHWVRSPRGDARTVDVGIGLSVAGLFCTGLLSGQSSAMSNWFLLLAPFAAAHFGSVRRGVAWAIVCLGCLAAMIVVERIHPLEPEFVIEGVEASVDRMVLLVALSVIAVIGRRSLDNKGATLAAEGEQLRAALAGLEHSRESLRHAHAQLETLVDNMSAGVAITETDSNVVVANDQLAAIFGFATGLEMQGSSAWELLRARPDRLADARGFKRRILELVDKGAPAVDDVVLADGSIFEREFVPVVLRGGNGGHLWVYRDVTEQRRTTQRLAQRVETDALTGLASRAAFEAALAEVSASGDDAVVFFLDLDGFKAVNDTLGHEQGDRLLQEIGARLRRDIRATDVAARMGGDEFTILLRGIGDMQLAARLADKLLARIAEPVALRESVSVSASIGIARLDASGAEEILRRADRAMYVAKHAGKHRWSIAP